eukprot:m.46124 g.46124  ORF g.46124 m.46124 type:complete len:360 (+) comp6724_c0_seq2:220-1299(+)
MGTAVDSNGSNDGMHVVRETKGVAMPTTTTAAARQTHVGAAFMTAAAESSPPGASRRGVRNSVMTADDLVAVLLEERSQAAARGEGAVEEDENDDKGGTPMRSVRHGPRTSTLRSGVDAAGAAVTESPSSPTRPHPSSSHQPIKPPSAAPSPSSRTNGTDDVVAGLSAVSNASLAQSSPTRDRHREDRQRNRVTKAHSVATTSSSPSSHSAHPQPTGPVRRPQSGPHTYSSPSASSLSHSPSRTPEQHMTSFDLLSRDGSPASPLASPSSMSASTTDPLSAYQHAVAALAPQDAAVTAGLAALRQRTSKLKAGLKAYEKQFERVHGRRPLDADKAADGVASYYRHYQEVRLLVPKKSVP